MGTMETRRQKEEKLRDLVAPWLEFLGLWAGKIDRVITASRGALQPGIAYAHVSHIRIQDFIAVNLVIHPPVEGSLRITTSINDLGRTGGGVACRGHALAGRGTVRAAVA